MSEEPETTTTDETPEASPASRLMVRLEVDAQAALKAIEGATSGLEAHVHQVLDTWWLDVVTNIGPRVDTSIHNQLHDLKETLRLRLVGLFHKEG